MVSGRRVAYQTAKLLKNYCSDFPGAPGQTPLPRIAKPCRPPCMGQWGARNMVFVVSVRRSPTQPSILRKISRHARAAALPFLYRQPILSKCIARGGSSPPFPFTKGQGADLHPPVFLKRRPLLSHFVLAPQPAGVETEEPPRQSSLFTKTNCLLVLTGCTGFQPARYRYRRRPPPQGAVPRANTHYLN